MFKFPIPKSTLLQFFQSCLAPTIYAPPPESRLSTRAVHSSGNTSDAPVNAPDYTFFSARSSTKYTNTNTQIHKHKYTNTQIQTCIRPSRNTSDAPVNAPEYTFFPLLVPQPNTQIQIYKYTNSRNTSDAAVRLHVIGFCFCAHCSSSFPIYLHVFDQFAISWEIISSATVFNPKTEIKYCTFIFQS